MPLNRDAMLSWSAPPQEVVYTERDTVFFALSIGIGLDPLDSRQLPYVYEKNLLAFPTMAGVLGWLSPFDNTDFGIDRRRNVVAGFGIDILSPLPTQGRLSARTRIVDVEDKGKGALITVRRDLESLNGVPIATVDTTIYNRGGGSGGPQKGSETGVTFPDRNADCSCDLPTPSNIALLYRLNGDHNPLHVDPEFASKVGFDRPILHGQATFSVAVHALLRSLAGYEAARFKGARARIVKPFYPGETMRTEAWLVGETVIFRSRSLERDVMVLDQGVATIAKPSFSIAP